MFDRQRKWKSNARPIGFLAGVEEDNDMPSDTNLE